MNRHSFDCTSACFQYLVSRKGFTRQEAVRLSIALICAKIAKNRQIFPEHIPLVKIIPHIPGFKFFDNMIGAACEVSEIITNVSDKEISPRTPGEVYQSLLEVPDLKNEGSKYNLRSQRKRSGSFFTPESIVDKIINLVFNENFNQKDLCDPAAGCGFFLLGAAQKIMRESGLFSARKYAYRHLFAADRDGEALVVAQASLWLLLSTEDVFFTPPQDHFLTGDSLIGNNFEKEKSIEFNSDAMSGIDWFTVCPDINEKGGFDFVVGNPPYNVLTNFKANPELKKYSSDIRSSGLYRHLRGQINLYRCFIERGLQLLKDGGRLSYIVPASFMMDGVTATLRQELLREHGADWFEVFDESHRIFDFVAQGTVIFRAQKNFGKSKQVLVDEMPVSSDFLSLLPGMEIPRATKIDWKMLAWLQKNTLRKFEEVAVCAVGEVDQTVYRDYISDQNTGTLLLRGIHLSPFICDLSQANPRQRYIDGSKFLAAKKGSAEKCRAIAAVQRIAQLGIRNMETSPRLVAAICPAGVYLGNSLNYYIPSLEYNSHFILGLLNSSLYNWRFSLTSSNNNINLCEIKPLPLPQVLLPEKVTAIENATKVTVELAKKNKNIAESRLNLDYAVFEFFNLPQEFRAYLTLQTNHKGL